MTQSKQQISKFNRELFNNREEFLTPFDSLFDNIISKAYPTFSQEFGVEFFGNNSYPKVDVIDHEDKITIEAEIPGLGKEDVSVDLEENVLTISGSCAAKTGHDTQRNARYIRKELKRSSFKRSFKLGKNINYKKIEASFNNGILLISVPKKEATAPKKVKIL